MSLKELTQHNHDYAEKTKFAQYLLSGNISPQIYYQYITNKYYVYVMLEESIRMLGFPQEFVNIFRAEKIRDDMQELERDYGLGFHPHYTVTSTHLYINRIEDLQGKRDYRGLLAHLYVNHFGDLHGGQIIKKLTPGSGTMYEFENAHELKKGLRELLADDMADEANIAFEYNIGIMEELGNYVPSVE